jgi:hypothetical protein
MKTSALTIFPIAGGFYALLAAHLASLLMNWEADTLVFRQRMRRGKPAKAIQVSTSTSSFLWQFNENVASFECNCLNLSTYFTCHNILLGKMLPGNSYQAFSSFSFGEIAFITFAFVFDIN